MEKQRLAPIISTQKEMLVEFLQSHQELQTGQFNQQFTYKKAQKLWEELSVILNAIPGGAKKDWRQWRKTWQDLKKNTKAKVCKEKKYSAGTGGGGPSQLPKLDDSEAKILSIISPTTINGHQTKESLVEFSFKANAIEREARVELTETRDKDLEVTNMTLAEPDIENCPIILLDRNYTVEIPEPNISTNTMPHRVTKSKRLENSLKISQQLANVENQKKQVTENYYKEKTTYLRWKMEYQKDMLQEHRNANLIKQQILNELKIIREKLGTSV